MKEVKAVRSETSPSSEQVVVSEGLAATRAPAGRWVPTPHEALGHRRWNDEAVGGDGTLGMGDTALDPLCRLTRGRMFNSIVDGNCVSMLPLEDSDTKASPSRARLPDMDGAGDLPSMDEPGDLPSMDGLDSRPTRVDRGLIFCRTSCFVAERTGGPLAPCGAEGAK